MEQHKVIQSSHITAKVAVFGFGKIARAEKFPRDGFNPWKKRFLDRIFGFAPLSMLRGDLWNQPLSADQWLLHICSSARPRSPSSCLGVRIAFANGGLTRGHGRGRRQFDRPAHGALQPLSDCVKDIHDALRRMARRHWRSLQATGQ